VVRGVQLGVGAHLAMKVGCSRHAPAAAATRAALTGRHMQGSRPKAGSSRSISAERAAPCRVHAAEGPAAAAVAQGVELALLRGKAWRPLLGSEGLLLGGAALALLLAATIPPRGEGAAAQPRRGHGNAAPRSVLGCPACSAAAPRLQPAAPASLQAAL
jgi:hypothetical protein